MTGSATWNESSCNKLAAIAAKYAKRKMRLSFNTHLRDTVPEGVEGAQLVKHTSPDSLGGLYARAILVQHHLGSHGSR